MNAPFHAPDTPDLRTKLEAAVERLLAILDEMEADPDLEPGDNEDGCTYEDQPPPRFALDEDSEPSLGAPENHLPHWSLPAANRGNVADQRHWSAGEGNMDEEPETDEPSLGWTATIKQVGFGWAGGLDDAEGEHDGREPQGDEEPYLAGTDTDLEHDPAECGIADCEGASEQGLPTGGHLSHVE